MSKAKPVSDEELLKITAQNAVDAARRDTKKTIRDEDLQKPSVLYSGFLNTRSQILKKYRNEALVETAALARVRDLLANPQYENAFDAKDLATMVETEAQKRSRLQLAQSMNEGKSGDIGHIIALTALVASVPLFFIPGTVFLALGLGLTVASILPSITGVSINRSSHINNNHISVAVGNEARTEFESNGKPKHEAVKQALERSVVIENSNKTKSAPGTQKTQQAIKPVVAPSVTGSKVEQLTESRRNAKEISI